MTRRQIGFIALWVFAIIGAANLLGTIAFYYFMSRPARTSDAPRVAQTRVISVLPSPNNYSAAIVYLISIPGGRDLVRVVVTGPPFPNPGDSIRPGDDVLSLAHPAVEGWASRTGDWAKSLPSFVDIHWDWPSIDFCPAEGTKLVRFDAERSTVRDGKGRLCRF